MHEFEFDEARFCHTFHHYPIRLEPALQLLTAAGYIRYSEGDERKARLRFFLERDQLYHLKQMSQEDKIVESLLRLYSGLFADYQFIDEDRIALHAGMDKPKVYLTLRGLDKRGILSFIPQKTVPHILFTQHREESKYLQFMPSVYQDRKRDYTERVTQMICYAKSECSCRSKTLLSYFGERQLVDCGQCDVCLQKKKMAPQIEAIIKTITQILSDQKPHHIRELRQLSCPAPLIKEALTQMNSKGLLRIEDFALKLVS